MCESYSKLSETFSKRQSKLIVATKKLHENTHPLQLYTRKEVELVSSYDMYVIYVLFSRIVVEKVMYATLYY